MLTSADRHGAHPTPGSLLSAQYADRAVATAYHGKVTNWKLLSASKLPIVAFLPQ